MKATDKLTNTAVERFKCPEGRKQAVKWDGETRGFGVRVSADGKTRTYILQYRVKGTKQERQITIGRHNDPWRVDDARAKALEIKAQMNAGVDPVIKAQEQKEERERQAVENEAQSITLRQVMEHYLIHKRTKHGPLRPASKADIRRHVEVNLADWADKPVSTITRESCLARFETLSQRAAGQANQCFVNVRALLNHAREMFATEDGDYPLLPVNPVQRMFKIRKPNPETPKDGRIPQGRIGKVWAMLQKRRNAARTVDDRTAADWVCFMLLTGCRRTESGSLRWSNVNLDEGWFNLPADVVKNHNGITLPMSAALHELLTARKALPPPSEKVARRRSADRPDREQSDYVFPSWGKAGYITEARATMEAVSEAAGCTITIHDLRRTFDDVAMECKVDSDQRRQLLNHLAADVHARHYANNRKSLAAAVEAIGAWITAQGDIAAAMLSGANVVALRG